MIDALLAVSNKELNDELKSRGHKFYKSASLTQSMFLVVDCLDREGRVSRSVSLERNTQAALLVCQCHRPLRSRMTLGRRIEGKNGHWEFLHVQKIWGEPNGTPHILETNRGLIKVALKKETVSIKSLTLLFQDDDQTVGEANPSPSFI